MASVAAATCWKTACVWLSPRKSFLTPQYTLASSFELATCSSKASLIAKSTRMIEAAGDDEDDDDDDDDEEEEEEEHCYSAAAASAHHAAWSPVHTEEWTVRPKGMPITVAFRSHSHLPADEPGAAAPSASTEAAVTAEHEAVGAERPEAGEHHPQDDGSGAGASAPADSADDSRQSSGKQSDFEWEPEWRGGEWDNDVGEDAFREEKPDPPPNENEKEAGARSQGAGGAGGGGGGGEGGSQNDHPWRRQQHHGDVAAAAVAPWHQPPPPPGGAALWRAGSAGAAGAGAPPPPAPRRRRRQRTAPKNTLMLSQVCQQLPGQGGWPVRWDLSAAAMWDVSAASAAAAATR
jgi:hypothetical protein